VPNQWRGWYEVRSKKSGVGEEEERMKGERSAGVGRRVTCSYV
jgi:hypothetical protein